MKDGCPRVMLMTEADIPMAIEPRLMHMHIKTVYALKWRFFSNSPESESEVEGEDIVVVFAIVTGNDLGDIW